MGSRISRSLDEYFQDEIFSQSSSEYFTAESGDSYQMGFKTVPENEQLCPEASKPGTSMTIANESPHKSLKTSRQSSSEYFTAESGDSYQMGFKTVPENEQLCPEASKPGTSMTIANESPHKSLKTSRQSSSEYFTAESGNSYQMGFKTVPENEQLCPDASKPGTSMTIANEFPHKSLKTSRQPSSEYFTAESGNRYEMGLKTAPENEKLCPEASKPGTSMTIANESPHKSLKTSSQSSSEYFTAESGNRYEMGLKTAPENEKLCPDASKPGTSMTIANEFPHKSLKTSRQSSSEYFTAESGNRYEMGLKTAPENEKLCPEASKPGTSMTIANESPHKSLKTSSQSSSEYFTAESGDRYEMGLKTAPENEKSEISKSGACMTIENQSPYKLLEIPTPADIHKCVSLSAGGDAAESFNNNLEKCPFRLENELSVKPEIVSVETAPRKIESEIKTLTVPHNCPQTTSTRTGTIQNCETKNDSLSQEITIVFDSAEIPSGCSTGRKDNEYSGAENSQEIISLNEGVREEFYAMGCLKHTGSSKHEAKEREKKNDNLSQEITIVFDSAEIPSGCFTGRKDNEYSGAENSQEIIRLKEEPPEEFDATSNSSEHNGSSKHGQKVFEKSTNTESLFDANISKNARFSNLVERERETNETGDERFDARFNEAVRGGVESDKKSKQNERRSNKGSKFGDKENRKPVENVRNSPSKFSRVFKKRSFLSSSSNWEITFQRKKTRDDPQSQSEKDLSKAGPSGIREMEKLNFGKNEMSKEDSKVQNIGDSFHSVSDWDNELTEENDKMTTEFHPTECSTPSKRKLWRSKLKKNQNKINTFPGRNPFVPWERKAMLNYLIERKATHKAKGLVIWKEMIEDGLLTHRTPQSLHNHFQKYLLPNIETASFLGPKDMDKFLALKKNTRRKES